MENEFIKSTRVAIIGSGPSGLSLIHALRQHYTKGGTIPGTIVCFEKQSTIGGLWNATWKTGLDEYGYPIHSSMYKHLWSNGPKEALEYGDYSFEQHFGKCIPSFPPRAVIMDYIRGRARTDLVEQYCRFNTIVTSVIPHSVSFTVTSRNLITKSVTEEEFDYVVVAVGHYSTPHMPVLEGIETFEGRILHSHDFRNAREFVGHKVLVVGSSYSAEDISLQLVKFGVTSVTISWRSKPLGFKFPKNINEKPQVLSVQATTVTFKDGTTLPFSVIILCTGYQHHYPFLPSSLALDSPNILYPPLYKGIVFPTNHRLLYVGAQDQFFTFSMFDIQGKVVTEIITGKIDIPTETESITQDITKWMKRGEQVVGDTNAMIDFQRDYTRELCQLVGEKEELFVEGAIILKEWERHKVENILTYRDQCFVSIVTKKMAPTYILPWWEAFNDSLDTYLKSNF